MSGSRLLSQQKRGWTKEQYDLLVSLSGEGKSCTEISLLVNKKSTVVRQKSIQLGLIKEARFYDPATEEAVVKCLREELSVLKITKLLGVSKGLVKAVRDKHQVDNFCVGTLTQTEAAYMAGIIDGEGCIMLSARGNRKQLPRIMVYVANTNFDLIHYIKATVKCGAIHQHTRVHHKNAGNRKDQMRWNADGRCAIRILEQIEPFMICKFRQSQVVRKFYERYLTNHPYLISEEEERDISDMIAEIHRLNRRGRE